MFSHDILLSFNLFWGHGQRSRPKFEVKAKICGQGQMFGAEWLIVGTRQKPSPADKTYETLSRKTVTITSPRTLSVVQLISCCFDWLHVSGQSFFCGYQSQAYPSIHYCPCPNTKIRSPKTNYSGTSRIIGPLWRRAKVGQINKVVTLSRWSGHILWPSGDKLYGHQDVEWLNLAHFTKGMVWLANLTMNLNLRPDHGLIMKFTVDWV